LGWLETFRGVPYKFGSSQAEVREYRAADCADFVVGGYQKMGGAGLGDMGTMTMLGAWAGLFDVIHGEVDWSVTPCLDTRTRNPVTWGPEAVRPGDIVLYKGHVGVLTRDQPPLGLLDPEDMVIHHLYQPPRETPLAEVWSGPLAVIRWKDFSPWQRRLKELGLYSGRVDGIFNAELERAVRKVQKNKGLKTDGRPNRETWRVVGGL
jgi:cell wall-associated NlpC family hydrolase